MSFCSVTTEVTFCAHQFFLEQSTILEVMLPTALPAHKYGALFNIVPPATPEATNCRPIMVEDIYLIRVYNCILTRYPRMEL